MNLILILFFIIRTLRNALYHLFWWQIKEYRLDRMLVYLRETYQGKKWMFGVFSSLKWFLLFSYLFLSKFYLSDIARLRDYHIEKIFFFGVLGVYFLEALFNLGELRRGWRRPQFRPKSIGLLVVILGVELGLIGFMKSGGAIGLIVLDKLLAPLTATLVLGINVPFEIYKKYLIKKAKEKMRRNKKIKVIGVTGSFGKTTTKEFIAQILSQKFRVLKTMGSQNTNIGVAELILKKPLGEFEIFVCEMAAYHRGEIAQICQMLKPNLVMAVITGINEQHQSLFGSLETTLRAKFELVEALPKEGIVIFNKNNSYCRQMAHWAKKRGLRVRLQDPRRLRGTKGLIEGVFRENLALARAVALQFGFKKEEIAKVVKNLRLPKKTMNIVKKGSLTLIDDTFNANPEGVLAALEFLDKSERSYKKILVLQPLIELGKYAQEIHERIGEKAAKTCDQIILTNKNFYEGFMKGAGKVRDGEKKVKVGGELRVKKGTILFEGKEAERYLL